MGPLAEDESYSSLAEVPFNLQSPGVVIARVRRWRTSKPASDLATDLQRPDPQTQDLHQKRQNSRIYPRILWFLCAGIMASCLWPMRSSAACFILLVGVHTGSHWIVGVLMLLRFQVFNSTIRRDCQAVMHKEAIDDITVLLNKCFFRLCTVTARS